MKWFWCLYCSRIQASVSLSIHSIIYHIYGLIHARVCERHSVCVRVFLSRSLSAHLSLSWLPVFVVYSTLHPSSHCVFVLHVLVVHSQGFDFNFDSSPQHSQLFNENTIDITRKPTCERINILMTIIFQPDLAHMNYTHHTSILWHITQTSLLSPIDTLKQTAVQCMLKKIE